MPCVTDGGKHRFAGSAYTQPPPGSRDLIIDACHETKMRTAYLEGLECEAYRPHIAHSRALLIISSALLPAGLSFSAGLPASLLRYPARPEHVPRARLH